MPTDERTSGDGELRAPPATRWATLRRLGPGIIIAGSVVGSGELIATTKAAAEAGFWLLWLIVVGCVIKVFTQIELSRHTIVSMETPLAALDRLPGPRWRVNWINWFWVAVIVLIVSQQGGIVGGVGQSLSIARPVTDYGARYNRVQSELVDARVRLAGAREHGAPAERLEALKLRVDRVETRAEGMAEPADPYVWAVLIAVLTSAVLFVGQYGLIEGAATLFVGAFTVVTVLTFVLLQGTEWAVTGRDLAEGLSFRLPPTSPRSGVDPVGTALAAFGLIGIGAGELIMYPYWCLEKGYARFTGPRDESDGWLRRARGWIRVLHTDAWVSVAVYTMATVVFYLLGAAVLFRSGLNPSGSTMIRTLAETYVPVFGEWAYAVFVAGAAVVLYSTFFVVAAGFGRLVADLLGMLGLVARTDAARRKWTAYVSAAWPLLAVTLYVFVRAPAVMVLASGTAQALMLPVLGGAALYFRYRRLDPRLRLGRLWDAFLWLSTAGFVVVAGWSIFGRFLG